MLKYSNCVMYIAKKLTLNLPFSLFQFQNQVSVFSNSQGFWFRSQGPLQVVVRKIPSLLETLIISKFRIAFVCCVGFLKITCGENIGCKYWDSSGRWAPQPQSCTVGVWTAPSNEPMLVNISVFLHSTTLLFPTDTHFENIELTRKKLQCKFVKEAMELEEKLTENRHNPSLLG